ncbi:RICIN domain-containing protein [Streptomyces sp. NPDC004647]|uniref:RICIN domain-containing protein n=1 Tax=Streptomyces sp. NPDC004647 TaxID=3154671 RepID=UPI0033A0600B
MSETEQDDAKRRQRARFVDALTSTAQQPGERSRLGTRVAGATAVLALVAGGTLGLGAWRSYQADEEAKEQKLAAEQAAARKKFTPSPSRSATPKPTKPAQPTRRAKSPDPAPAAPSASPSKQQQKQQAEKKKVRPLVVTDHSGLLLKNAATGMCADLPDYGAGYYTMPVNQYYCDGSAADNQQWNLNVHSGDTGPGGASLVTISNAKDGLCMDVPERGPKPAGTQIQEANCHSSLDDNELWWLDPAGGDTVRIRNFVSYQLCLQVEGADSKAPDTRLVLDRCDADSDSRWLLTD